MTDWIEYKLPLESEILLEQHLRLIDTLPLVDLRQIARDTCTSYHKKNHLLIQAMKRVANLELDVMQYQTTVAAHQTKSELLE